VEENLPMILCGDINIAHKGIDLKNYKGNKKIQASYPRASMDD
jgi:exodeoxyribonuclease III